MAIINLRYLFPFAVGAIHRMGLTTERCEEAVCFSVHYDFLLFSFPRSVSERSASEYWLPFLPLLNSYRVLV